MVGDNIKKLRETLGMTQTKFAEQIGLTQGTIASVENNKRNVSQPVLLSISQKFGVRLEWLETGEGEMYTEQDMSLFARLEAENKLTPKGREFLEAFLRLPVSMQDTVVDATRVLATLYPQKADSELTPDEKAEVVRQESKEQEAAEKRETSTSSASTGTSGTSKKFGRSP